MCILEGQSSRIELVRVIKCSKSFDETRSIKTGRVDESGVKLGFSD